MHTLPRAVTAQFFTNPSAYAALRAHWRTLMTSDRRHTLAAEHHLLYLALIGKDWRTGFTPITNPRKLANGAFVSWSPFRALSALHSPWHESALLAPFDGHVTGAMLAQLRPSIPRPNAYRYQAADFQTGAWPFDAYCQPVTLVQ
jgi:hypothetical protein